MPLPVPSATGLAKYGGSNASPSRSASRSTMTKSGVGTPASRTTRFARPLWSVSAHTSGSEKTYGIWYRSSSAGTWASRPMPCMPSAMLKTRPQRSPRTRRSASRLALPMRSVTCPSDRIVSSSEWIVCSLSNSAVSSSE